MAQAEQVELEAQVLQLLIEQMDLQTLVARVKPVAQLEHWVLLEHLMQLATEVAQVGEQTLLARV